MQPLSLNEWSQAVTAERLREGEERRLASEGATANRWPCCPCPGCGDCPCD